MFPVFILHLLLECFQIYGVYGFVHDDDFEATE